MDTTSSQSRPTTHKRAPKPIFSWHRLPDYLAILVLAIGAILMIMPFMWMFSTSLRPVQESYRLPPAWFPTEFHWETYLAVFQSGVPIVAFALNTIKVRFPFRNALFVLLLASLMVPGQVTIIPVFIIMRQFGLVDDHLSIILPFLTSAFGVFLLRQAFLTLPQDLFDAAKIDGAGAWTVFMRIAVPLAGPSMAALAIISFNNTWNSYFYPLIFLNTWEKMTLPLGITALRGYLASNSATVTMAAVSMAILPVLLIFLIAQRWFIAGITRTGIKG